MSLCRRLDRSVSLLHGEELDELFGAGSVLEVMADMREAR